jgi:hypothetical protein
MELFAGIGIALRPSEEFFYGEYGKEDREHLLTDSLRGRKSSASLNADTAENDPQWRTAGI